MIFTDRQDFNLLVGSFVSCPETLTFERASPLMKANNNMAST